MKKTLSRIVLLGALFLGATAGAFGQSLAGAAARADDGDIWHLRDNPALLAALPDPFDLGVAYSSVDAAGAAVPFDFQSGTWGFSIDALNFLSYQFFTQAERRPTASASACRCSAGRCRSATPIRSVRA